MKQKVLMLVAVWCFCLSGTMRAQDGEGVNFLEGKSFSEALALAKEAGKMVFVDCYTSWCGPCRMMATQVFPQKMMGDYFNEKFVNLKVDMEKGEGPDLHKRFQVKAYPTFLFFDADGNEVHRIVGGDSDAAKFLEGVKDGLGEKGLKSMTARYEAGERDADFLMDYLDVLAAAYDMQRSNEVAGVLLKGREADMLDNPRLFDAFLKYNKSPMTDAFRYVLEHKAGFEARYDKDNLNRVMDMAWMAYPRTFVSKGADGVVAYDKEAMAAYVKEMKKWNVEKRDEIVLLSDIHVAEATGDWSAFGKNCTRYIRKFGANDMYLYNWVLHVKKDCRDAKVRRTAVGWMKDRIKAIEEEKAKEEPLPDGAVRAMPMMDFSKYYKDLIDQMEAV